MTDAAPAAPALPAGWPAMSIAQAHALLTAPGQPFEMATRDIRGVPTRTWKNAPPTLRDVFLAGRAHGDKVFLVHDDERVTFAAFARATATLAAQLVADGVGKGDRVAVVMRNLPEWPVAFFAAELCGAIVTPLNAWWTGSELEYGLSDSGTKILLIDAERLARLTEHLPNCPDLTRIYVTRSTEESGNPLVHRLEDVIGTPHDWATLPEVALPDVALDPEDDATIFYTSGTTGKPKGALGTHRNIVSNIMASAISAARTYLRRGEMPPTPDPAAPQKGSLLSVPFFHATGCHAVLSPSLFAGAKLVLMRKWDAEAAMALIERERLTSCGGVPTIAWQIIEHPNRDKYDLSSLEAVAYGGAPSAPELVRQIRTQFKGAAAGNGWGMTETSATFTHHMGEDYANRPDSAGPPVPVCDVKVTDPEGHEVPPGTVGELWGRGPNVVKEYWRKPPGDRRDLHRRLGPHRRPRPRRRRGLRLHHRPRQGHADPRRREHLLRRGRERALRPSGGDGRGDRRAAAPQPRRGTRRGRHAEARRPCHRRRAARPRRGAAGGVQGAGRGPLLGRAAAAQRQRQGPEARTAQAVRSRRDRRRGVTEPAAGHLVSPV